MTMGSGGTAPPSRITLPVTKIGGRSEGSTSGLTPPGVTTAPPGRPLPVTCAESRFEPRIKQTPITTGKQAACGIELSSAATSLITEPEQDKRKRQRKGGR